MTLESGELQSVLTITFYILEMFEMTNVELVKLWKSVVESKGTWADIVSGYRKATDSEAKDESLKVPSQTGLT